ncbi:uncharacterized protein BJ171DRAFT_580112 [Polychytrium aggregatum]|uniref:uncharacterized protein n=1 Tax=Polychytrium aggregatum TaxID=110093 RepID=UPI0022FF4593|nr:uncharacterized protein BJ171DRAFT_580112 [Polychytrium aggregatum]KAI9206037.1 hypothetical protein BJ171DRAFT_580112 [Polychytrium aggregatum]
MVSPQNPPLVVFGKHTFVAEEPDEVNFMVGEPILVLEKDELFGDGWWKGRNLRGEVGLFPANFITPENIRNVSIQPLLEVNDEWPDSPAESAAARPASIKLAAPARGASINNPVAYVNSLPSAQPTDWSPHQVQQWLISTGYANVTRIFVENAVTGAQLLQSTLNSLRDLGIESLTLRIDLMQSIVELKKKCELGLSESRTALPSESDPSSTQPQHLSYSSSPSPPPPSRVGAAKASAISEAFTLSDYLDANNTRASGSDARWSGSTASAGVPRFDAFDDPHIPTPDTAEPFFYDSNPSQSNSGDYSLEPPSPRYQTNRLSTASISSQPQVEGLHVNVHDFSNTDYEGQLMVKVGNEVVWKKRWCLVIGDSMFIFKSQENKHPIHVLTLSEGFSILPDDDNNKAKFAFKVTRPSTSPYRFSCETQIGLIGWINAVVRASQRAPKHGPVALVPIQSKESSRPNSGQEDPSEKFAAIQIQTPRLNQATVRGTHTVSVLSHQELPKAKYFPSTRRPSLQTDALMLGDGGATPQMPTQAPRAVYRGTPSPSFASLPMSRSVSHEASGFGSLSLTRSLNSGSPVSGLRSNPSPRSAYPIASSTSASPIPSTLSPNGLSSSPNTQKSFIGTGRIHEAGRDTISSRGSRASHGSGGDSSPLSTFANYTRYFTSRSNDSHHGS